MHNMAELQKFLHYKGTHFLIMKKAMLEAVLSWLHKKLPSISRSVDELTREIGILTYQFRLLTKSDC